MRVLFLNELVRPGGGGGCERHIADLFRGLRELGHEVAIAGDNWAQVLKWGDVVHVHNMAYPFGLECVEACRARGIPYLISLHDYWPFCFEAGALIYSQAGSSRIEDVIPGMALLGRGTWTTILRTFERQYSGKLLDIKPQGLEPVACTPEHPVLTVRKAMVKGTLRVNAWRKYNRKVGVASKQDMALDHLIPEWVEAGQLTIGDYLCVKPIEREMPWEIDLRDWANPIGFGHKRYYKKVQVDEDVAYFLGWYLAEGSSKDTPQLSLGAHEENYAQQLVAIIRSKFDIAASYKTANRSIRLRISCKPLAQFLRTHFGPNAREKIIPSQVLMLPKPAIVAFLRGYLAGDGSVSPHGSRVRASYITASRLLMQGLCLLLFKIGIVPTVARVKALEFTIRGKRYKNRGGYSISIDGQQLELIGIASNTHITKSRFVRANGFYLIPIKNIGSRIFEGKVYNLHSLNEAIDVPFITHNCPPRMGIWEGRNCLSGAGCDYRCGAKPLAWLPLVQASSTATFSTRAAEIFLAHGVKARVIPHGIDLAFWHSQPKAGLPGLRVGCVSAWGKAPWKGMHWAEEASKYLPGAAWRFLLGGASRETVRQLYWWADVVCVPSVYEETFCLVAAEAQACGTPVAAFPIGGLIDLASAWARDGSAEGLAGAILEAKGMAPKPMRGYQEMARDYERLYQELVCESLVA